MAPSRGSSTIFPSISPNSSSADMLSVHDDNNKDEEQEDNVLGAEIGGDNVSKGDGVAASAEAKKLVMEAALTSWREEDVVWGGRGSI
ncbi:hypothetical protein NL676_016696 [Syzygium grande]|nr:hypothetical protein NL676_016696 [Syzygium grande]